MSSPTLISFSGYTQLRLAAEKFVQSELSGNDASHDWFHISRVRSVALSLAAEEGIAQEDPRMELVELAALLHDIADWKYSNSETKGIEEARKFLELHSYPKEKVDIICQMIQFVGFKSELGRIEAAKSGSVAPVDQPDPLLLGIVQDSDRLDAIGAIGIARCFTYGGAKKRPLYDPSQPIQADITMEQYKESSKHQVPSINHFYEKLLKLKDLMKTNAGRKLAAKRHQFMLDFLQTFDDECAGRA